MTRIFKQGLLEYCAKLFNAKLENYQSDLKVLNDSYGTETKSSAGDKYETTREMIHIEKGKVVNQIEMVKKSLVQLRQLSNQNKEFQQVENGVLFLTKDIGFFLGIAIGEMEYEGRKIYCISSAAPIAKSFLGKKTGDKIFFNQQESEIINVL